MKKKSFLINWGDSLLEMLPSRALLLPHTKELLICDIHLGKAEYFQQNGIPLTNKSCLLYTSPSPRDKRQSRMPSSA